MSLEIFVLGCGGMMPMPNRHLTSVLARREGDLFLFDCGEGTQVSLKKLNLRWKKISVIFISHTHADHVTGLPGILMLSSQVDREEPLYIIGPPKIKEYVETSCRVLDMFINYKIIVKEISEKGIVYSDKNFKVKAFPLEHSKPCFGYSLEENKRPGIFFPEKAIKADVPKGPLWSKLQNGKTVVNTKGKEITSDKVMGPERNGRKFSYVTDTLFFPEISKEVSNSNLLICEGMFTKDLEESAKEKKHLTAEQAGILAKNAGGIDKMGLIHYSPRYTEWDLKQLRKEARHFFPDTFLTSDGQSISIQNSD